MVPEWAFVAMAVGSLLLGGLIGRLLTERKWAKVAALERKVGFLEGQKAALEEIRAQHGDPDVMQMARDTATQMMRDFLARLPGDKELEQYLGYPLEQADPAYVLGAMQMAELVAKALKQDGR